MPLEADHLRFILGLKLKTLRAERGMSLKDVATRAGMSISYLSEIEKGKKYPKPDKLIELGAALDVPFDELVSVRVTDELAPLKSLFSSSFVQEFPFDLFGLGPEDLMGLVREEPGKAGALIRTFLEIGQLYDVQVEHFLFAALRAYQSLHHNYFAELEAEAAAYRKARGWDAGEIDEAALRHVLVGEYGYILDTDTLARHPDLREFRSVYVDGPPPRLLLNARLLPEQRAFVLAREAGYRHLGLDVRATTSSWLEVESFDQVLNNFKASYFAGALLLDADRLTADLERFFALPVWTPDALLALMHRYRATPEMLLYRLTELAPQRFGLEEIFFMRFNRAADRDAYRLSKVFNMSRVPVPHGIGLGEHYCRRWRAMQMLARGHARAGTEPAVAVQRDHFLGEDAEFLTVSIARPLALSPGMDSCVVMGFRVDETLRRRVAWLDDPAIERCTVNLTCQRCPLPDCRERAAPPTLVRAQAAHARKVEALAALTRTFSEASARPPTR